MFDKRKSTRTDAKQIGAKSFPDDHRTVEPAANHAAGRRSRICIGTATVDPLPRMPPRYRIVRGNDDKLFEVDEHTGELFFTGTETDLKVGTTEFRLTVRAGDNGGSAEQRVLMSITRVPDFAVAGGEPDALVGPALPQRGGARVALGRIPGSDSLGLPLTYRLREGSGAELFVLDEATGELFFTGTAADLEHSDTGIELTVRADVQRYS